MSKRSIGERIAEKWREAHVPYDDELTELAHLINRAIRREKAKAWDEGARGLLLGPAKFREAHAAFAKTNPYRGRARR